MFIPVTVPSSSVQYEFTTVGGDIEFHAYLTSKHVDKKGKYQCISVVFFVLLQSHISHTYMYTYTHSHASVPMFQINYFT